MLKTEREREMIQLRVDGFTFNRLKPYTSWEKIFPRAYRFWKKYLDCVEPVGVTRLATRYINALDVPIPKTTFSSTWKRHHLYRKGCQMSLVVS